MECDRGRIEEKVREILETADLDAVTELKVRELAAESLAVDLSGLDSKMVVREAVEAFLLSLSDDEEEIRVNGGSVDGGEGGNANLVEERGVRVSGEGLNSNFVGGGKALSEQPLDLRFHCGGVEAPAKKSGDDELRFVCKLSNKRGVMIKQSGGKKVVLMGEFHLKDGKHVPGSRGISMNAEQWPAFSKSFPAIEEAIKELESRMRSQTNNADVHHVPAPELKKQKTEFHPTIVACNKNSRINPTGIIRFDGKNYHDWARQMELFLKQLKLEHVLTEPVPNAAGADAKQVPQILRAVQKWTDEDYLCRTNILNSLSDHLFEVYSKKAGTAKELWDELKLMYVTGDQGSRVAMVRKYMEFEMVEGKSVIDQVQELNGIADALVPNGMHVEENFHVSVIISKLPPSWREVAARLAEEAALPVWMLMNLLKQEEAKRGGRAVGGVWGGAQAANGAAERERKGKLCAFCGRRGHLEERCWNKIGKQ